jgi:hypothetical protein
LILLPIVASLLFTQNSPSLPAFNHRADDSPPLRLLIASLWGTILLLSVAGLWSPRTFAVLLVFQIIYKSGWLLTYALPLAFQGRTDRIAWGPAAFFLVIVLAWPPILVRSGALETLLASVPK